MGGLIGVTDSETASKVLHGELDLLTAYDPLVVCFTMLCSYSVSLGGSYLLYQRPGDGGWYCPMCELEERSTTELVFGAVSRCWMDECTDQVLVYCRQNNFLPKAQ